MKKHKIYDVNGKTIAFHGHLVASAQSAPIETKWGVILFKLSAYESDDLRWVLTINLKRPTDLCEEVLAFRRTGLIATANTFFGDFDPTAALDTEIRLCGIAQQIAAFLTAVDEEYHSAARRLVSGLTDYRTATREPAPEHSRRSSTPSTKASDDPEHVGIVNRIKNFLGLGRE